MSPLPASHRSFRAFPDAVRQLAFTAIPLANYPIRAEARTGENKPDASLDAQGATLKAHADPLLAQATATMKAAEGQAGFSFGNAETIANCVMADTTGTAAADSRVTKINIGNVILIDSVTSHAEAATDGVAAGVPTGATVVQGMTIAGQPAYVDEQGVHIGEQGQPANAVASQIANQALVQAGFSFYIAQHQQEYDGGPSASYTAGSLIIVWEPPGNPSGNVFVIGLGGARVAVTATPGSGFSVNTPAPSIPSVTTPIAAATPARPGISSTPLTSASPAAAAKAPSTTVGGKPIAAATVTGIAGQVVLGLLGSGLMFFGFRRVADDIVDRVPSSCPLETT